MRVDRDIPHARLGCRTCDTTYGIPYDDRFQLRMLAFFDEHGTDHRPWIDVSSAGPLQLPRPRPPEQRVRPAAAD